MLIPPSYSFPSQTLLQKNHILLFVHSSLQQISIFIFLKDTTYFSLSLSRLKEINSIPSNETEDYCVPLRDLLTQPSPKLSAVKRNPSTHSLTSIKSLT